MAQAKQCRNKSSPKTFRCRPLQRSSSIHSLISIALKSDDKTARIWDAVTGKPIAVLRGHAGPVMYVAWSPNGKWLATASEDETARLWDLSTIPQGNLFDIACALLPDTDLQGLGAKYGVNIDVPICRVRPPPPPWMFE